MRAFAGDLLRGGAASGVRSARSSSPGNLDAVTEQARANAQDALARTAQTLKEMQVMQDAARTAAQRATSTGRNPNPLGGNLPSVPNGLVTGGLEVAPGAPKNPFAPQPGEDGSLWRGAKLPTQLGLGGESVVTVEQKSQQAVLTWRTFNIGKSTRLVFNQDRGGAQKSEWIAFNKVNDPSGSPTQILGKIEAPGQVYIINRNGIVFGGASQVNVHSLAASSLPINDALLQRGLLNQEAGNVRFLFSSTNGDPAFQLTGGASSYTLAEKVVADTTPTVTFRAAAGTTSLSSGTDYTLSKDAAGRTTVTFTVAGLAKVGSAQINIAYTAVTGDVTVLPGARLTSPTSGAHVGGRISLIGPNVSNEGTISTADGQTILAAGREVGFTEHSSADPSLRGLDVFVGSVDGTSGRATNAGLIDIPRGSVVMAGKDVRQAGVIESSTTVSLNGRIDLLANYGAATNPGFDPTKPALGAPFLFRNTGTVTLAEGSVARILPELANEETAVGTELALRSRVNIQGQALHFAGNSTLLAPGAEVNVSAGEWNYLPPLSNFVNSRGQIYLESGATINVAGSVDVSVPIAQNLLELQLRGSELADSPLQRDGLLRGAKITVDIRKQGVFNGLAWVGTPLGDASGFVGLIQRTVGELTTAGGTVKLSAGESVIMQPGAKVDVSGGWLNVQGGMVTTTRVLSGGQLLDISQATPDRIYDGIYTGTFTDTTHAKYGLNYTYTSPLALLGTHYEATHVQGANGGAIAITAPSLALDGTLLGRVAAGPHQRETPPGQSELALTFQNQTLGADSQILSPTPPKITFQNAALAPADPFAFAADGSARALRDERKQRVALAPDLLASGGFGKLTIDNSDGDIDVPAIVKITATADSSITLSAANIDWQGKVQIPSGNLSFKTYNYSPHLPADTTLHEAFPALKQAGRFKLGPRAELNTAGLIVDDSRGASLEKPLALDGGSVSITGYDVDLRGGSTIDVSGGLNVGTTGQRTYGNGGSISIAGGQDPGQNRDSVLGGKFLLGATLKAYSGAKGGALALRAQQIQIGGQAPLENTLRLDPAFFSTGGFASFALTGLGGATARAEDFVPGIAIAPGTIIAPVAESWVAVPFAPGSEQAVFAPVVKPVGLRTPVSLSFNTPGVVRPDGTLLIRGDFIMGEGAAITTDPKGSVTVEGQTVAVLGSITAPGGSISLTGASKFPRPAAVIATEAQATVYLGPTSLLSTAGTTVLTPDAFGRRLGSVLAGGTITVAGNIVADRGAVLDVSGTSGVLDLPPASVGETGAVNGRAAGAPVVPFRSGLNAPLWSTTTVPTRVESDAGTITLKGAQELLADATLLGKAGGPSALGGSLFISSGRFYGPNDPSPTPSDVSLIVQQGGLTRPQIAYGPHESAIGQPVLGPNGVPLAALGYFTAATFAAGGFDSLSLAGNVRFTGPVTINAARDLIVAGGGFLTADAAVNLTAAHAVLGTPFLPPVAPDQRTAPFFLNGQPYYVPPTFGAGSLAVKAGLIELGNLSLQNIGRASFIADRGDIRGAGTLDIAGDLYFRAAQLYPVSGANFTIAAYDYQVAGGNRPGSVTVASSGRRDLPLSAGGQLAIFASRIDQRGVVVAPSGTIQIGWEDAASAPLDLLSGKKVTLAQTVTLGAGSVTSVSLVNPWTGAESLIPYGLSTDGANWVDPAGQDISAGKLANKEVRVEGARLAIKKGATIDLSGGGDLYAYRWVKGTGGSSDVLKWNFQGAWKSGTAYGETQIVSYHGANWYARLDIPPDASATPPSPGAYWKQVTQSFAVIPGYHPDYAPYGTFSGGDPGYVQSGVSVGDRVHLGASAGLPEGTYTLLPARYALLPGAVLVTPQTGAPVGTFANPDGGSYASGYRFNDLNTRRQVAPIFTRFEVAPRDVFRARGEYQDYLANDFLTQRAQALEVEIPRRPVDAGYLRLRATHALALDGNVRAEGAPRFHDGWIDIASTAADITISGSTAGAGANRIVLDATRLNKFGAESLFIGGVRDLVDGKVKVTVTTDKITVDNAGSPLAAAEVILAANENLTLETGAVVKQSGLITGGRSKALYLGTAGQLGSGDGVLLRVSSDFRAETFRAEGSVDTSDTTPTLTVKGGALVSGTSLLLDSTYGTSLDSTAHFIADFAALNSGQILFQLDPNLNVNAPGLLIKEGVLRDLEATKSLSLLTYRSLDLYGAGSFEKAGNLVLHAAEIRGFANGGGVQRLSAGSITLDNRAGTVGPGADPALAGVLSGTLELDAPVFHIGTGDLQISQLQLVDLKAPGGLLFTGSGSVTTQGDLHALTPFVTAERAVKNSIVALGDLTFDAPPGKAAARGGGLGATLTFTGQKVAAHSLFSLHSGALTLQATGNDPTDGVTVGGRIDVTGVSQDFHDLTRYTNGGEIRLVSKSGDVTIDPAAVLDASAPAAGGDAGSISISAPLGDLVLNGTLLGKAGVGGKAGSFSLEVSKLPGTAAVAPALDAGGFTEAQSFRIRTGDVTIDSLSTAHRFQLSTDGGSITVMKTIDASGETGGRIDLVSAGNLTVAAGATLTVEGKKFSNAGKGGAITLEAGAQIDGAVDYGGGAVLKLEGGTIVLSVDEVDGIADPVAHAAAVAAAQALGRFTGTLHLRAPQTAAGAGVNIAAVTSTVSNASNIVVEGYRLFDLQQGGRITNTGAIQALGGTIAAGVNVQGSVKANGSLFTANTAAIRASLFSGANAGLASLAVIAPGAEIINRAGDVSIGTIATTTSANDWDLSSYHYSPTGVAGTAGVPGVLTVRASGNLAFFNGVSDGFASSLFNAELSAATPGLAANAQSWSYRLTAGADLQAADFHRVQNFADLTALGTGSLLLGKHLAPTGTSTAQIAPRLFQVIRTGSGEIDISTGRDVVLQNLFANIYTAGTRLDDATATMGGRFELPRTKGGYQSQFSLGGGDVSIAAQGDIHREALIAGSNGGSQGQLPMNWLYRRGAVDPATGLFRPSPSGSVPRTFGEIASTSWWIDFSNFFEGVGALGGGNVTLLAGGSIANVDAVIPTNARMPGKDSSGNPVAPDARQLIELGGGDLLVRAGGDLDAGAYYVERGKGTLRAGGEIKTNSTRNTSTANTSLSRETNWLPTTLFLGQGSFEVSALGNIALGPVANPFLLPLGFNNTFSYKTYFSTYAAADAVNVTSIGGSVTLRQATTPPEVDSIGTAVPILQQWMKYMQQTATGSTGPQPWLNLAETDLGSGAFATASTLLPGTLKVTAASGDINIIGRLNLSPAAKGTVELLAGQAINGLQPTGGASIGGAPVTVWSSAQINLSDANPASLPGVAAPLAFQNFILANPGVAQSANTLAAFLAPLDDLFNETGSTTGSFSTKLSLHGAGLQHTDDHEPVRLYTLGGNIADLTLYSAKFASVVAGKDITDIGLYLQNVNKDDVSIVSAGRDIVAYNNNSPLRAAATVTGNYIAGTGISSTTGATIIPDSEAGDIQISGPGTLEVLAGRDLDLGSGLNRIDGTGTGITSVGNGRNPSLPFAGASIIGGAGIGPSAGLAESALDFESFATGDISAKISLYRDELRLRHPGLEELDPSELTGEARATLALDLFYFILRDAGRAATAAGGTGGGYEDGYAAIDKLFGDGKYRGKITTQARDIRTRNGGGISLFAPGGTLTLGSTAIGKPEIPPGIVTESGGAISIFTKGDVDIGISRIFTLRGGDIIIWSSEGNIAAGSSAKTVKSAPPTRVLIDLQSADVKTDLAGLATGGGIGVLATVAGVSPGDVDLIAPKGVVDAGDAGIRATGNLNIAATAVLNADNISVGGSSTGVPSAPVVAAPNLAGLAAASSAAGSATAAAGDPAAQQRREGPAQEEPPSIINVEVLDFGPNPDGEPAAALPAP